MSNRATRLSCVLVASVLLAAAATASAQPISPPVPTERHGLFFGGGLWGGNISCDGSDCGGFRAAGGGSLHIGYLFTPRFGLLFDGWAMTSSKNDVNLTFVTGTLNVRYWVAPVIWIQGGLGGGHAVISVGGFAARGDDVPVGQLAAGFEIVRGRSWALDLQLKVAQGTSTDDGAEVQTGRSAGIGVAFTWFQRRYPPAVTMARR